MENFYSDENISPSEDMSEIFRQKSKNKPSKNKKRIIQIAEVLFGYVLGFLVAHYFLGL